MRTSTTTDPGRRPAGRTCRGGFSLIELLLAVTLMGLGVVAVALQVYHSLESTALRTTAGHILHMARYARLMASQHHQTCTLHIDLDTGDFWLTVAPGGIPVAEQSSEPTDPVVRNVLTKPGRLGERLRFHHVRVDDDLFTDSGQADVVFRTDGTAQAAVVEVAAQQRTYSVVINPLTSRPVLRSGAWAAVAQPWSAAATPP